MMSRSYFLVFLISLLGVPENLVAFQEWQVFDTGTTASLRGLIVVDDQVAWACGSKGTVIRTVDGGSTWTKHTVTGFSETGTEAIEFRSIHAWDSQKVLVATAGQPARIMRSLNGGVDWDCAFEHPSPQAFLDGMRFWDKQRGLAFSDPVDGKMLILKTDDGGGSWSPIDSQLLPSMDKGEAGFAASNSSLFLYSPGSAWIGLGGTEGGESRMFQTQDGGRSWAVHTVPPVARNESSGIFSIAFQDVRRGIAVGGNYRLDSDASSNIAITEDGGLHWRHTNVNRPRGFRSSIVFAKAPSGLTWWGHQAVWIACGPSGCDWSTDGETWESLSDIGFHALSVSAQGAVWASGAQGRVAILLPLNSSID
ncbi:MAG: YCF48-related protein [Pirellula sp.]